MRTPPAPLPTRATTRRMADASSLAGHRPDRLGGAEPLPGRRGRRDLGLERALGRAPPRRAAGGAVLGDARAATARPPADAADAEGRPRPGEARRGPQPRPTRRR